MKLLHNAGDGAVKTTVEQTLMRGLVTAFPCVRPGLPRSASGRRLRSTADTIYMRVSHRDPASALRIADVSATIRFSAMNVTSFDLMSLQSAAPPHGRSPIGRPPSRVQSLS